MRLFQYLSISISQNSIRLFVFIVLIINCVDGVIGTTLGASFYKGANVAGAEFGSIPGTFGKDYIYPTGVDFQRIAKAGGTIIRLPFRWERLQHELGGALDKKELSRLKKAVKEAQNLNLAVILDVHNYARYQGDIIGSPEVPYAEFSQFWRLLATHFANQNDIFFGLMNEPNRMTTESWLRAANYAAAAIRATGAKNLLLVSGNGWSGAHSWNKASYGTPNANIMKHFIDPINHYVFEVHQYLDHNFSGQHSTCQSETIGIKSLQSFTNWARENTVKAFLGEFAVANNPRCLSALDAMLKFIHANQDVWMGWTYWADGPWWPDNDPFTLKPLNHKERPQMKILKHYFSKK